jgi:hypothetical protein
MRYTVRVQPRSSQDRVVRNSDGSLKVYLRVPPAEGKANEALKEIIADEFGVSRSRVKILRGERSREKVIEIW